MQFNYFEMTYFVSAKNGLTCANWICYFDLHKAKGTNLE